LTIIFIVGSLYIIKHTEIIHESDIKPVNLFIFPSIIIFSFFGGCYLSSLIVENEINIFDKYCGIFYLLLIGLILLISNFVVFTKEKLLELTAGTKFSKVGVIMVLGIGAIIFGFIDNFGMRLGTEALDNLFVQSFLNPLSTHFDFENYKENIKDNFGIINEWTEHDWRKVMNHVLRFKSEISKNKSMKDLSDALKTYNCKPLNIPKTILEDKDNTNRYVDNLRTKYDIIDGSKAMLGNSFSNFCAALLGAGVAGIFTVLTSFDEYNVGDNKLEENFNDIVEKFTPFIEACFILIGCLIPIILNIAMKRSSTDHNNIFAWSIIFVLLLVILLTMYASYKLTSKMTRLNKQNGIIKTLTDLKLRYHINSNVDKKLNNEINIFLNTISNLL
jgi:Ca2+/Na+ antiporter